MVWWTPRSWDTNAVTMFFPGSPLCSTDTSPCGRTSHSGTGSLCLCKLKRVPCIAIPCRAVCVCVCAREHLFDLCMLISGFCVTSRKSQEKQNWTLCKQPGTDFWSVRPTLYLHYQLCSLLWSCSRFGIVSAGSSKRFVSFAGCVAAADHRQTCTCKTALQVLEELFFYLKITRSQSSRTWTTFQM